MKKGFTLVELAIVIVILGFLGALVLSVSTKRPTEITESNYPHASGYLVDDANVLKEETKRQVAELAADFDEKDFGQIAVLTVESTKPLSIEQYSIGLADEWKVGYKGKDNGFIFIIATKDRKTRIEVGRGFEGIVNDAKAGKLLDTHAIPHSKNDDWDSAVIAVVKALIAEVEGGEI